MTKQEPNNNEESKNENMGKNMGMGIGVGIAIGAGIGAAMGNIGVGMAIGGRAEPDETIEDLIEAFATGLGIEDIEVSETETIVIDGVESLLVTLTTESADSSGQMAGHIDNGQFFVLLSFANNSIWESEVQEQFVLVLESVTLLRE